MNDVPAHEKSKGDGTFVMSVRVLTWAPPIGLWLIHIFVIVPRLNSLSGDAQFLAAMQFFMVSALVMIGCLVISIVVCFMRRTRGDLLPLLLNLSWLYYLKVLFDGPTIGNL